MRAHRSRRGGFTLVELLVAVGIILVLVGLSVLVANSGIVGNARTSSGSDRIAGWLMQARAKAQRDNAPRGIRFIPDAAGYVREAQLIEVPEPYTLPAGNTLMTEHSPAGKRVYVVGPNAADVLNNITPGDTLSIPSTGTIHRVASISGVFNITLGMLVQPAVEIVVFTPALLPDLGAAALTAAPAAPTPTYSTTTFGFIRQARPTFGEPPFLVPDTVAICLNLGNTSNAFNVANPSLSLIQPTTVNGVTNFDIVFGPSGEVQNAGGLGRFVLWTINPEALAGSPRAGGDDRTVYEQAGEMRLIVVYTKTGAVAVQPIALPPAPGPNVGHDPYSTTKDGVGSGL